MSLTLGLWISLQGCVVPWVDPTDEETDSDVDPTDDTEPDTEDTDGGGGSDVELYDECSQALDQAFLPDGTYAGTFRGADISGLDPDCPAIEAATGQDLYRRIRVPDGKMLTVELRAANRDVVLTLLRECDSAPAACVVGADSAVVDGKEKLTYTNSSGAPEEFVLGVHLFDDSERGGDFTLTVLREDD